MTERLLKFMSSWKKKNSLSLPENVFDGSLLFKAVQRSYDGIALLNFNQTILFANERFWSIYDIPLSERTKYMSQKWDCLYSPKGQAIIQNEIYPALEQNSYWTGAEWVKTQKGKKFFADLSIVKYETGYLGLVRDRTDFITACEQNKSLTRELHDTQKDNAIMQAIRSMVHDFNNTLSVIKGHAELLEESKDFTDTERQSFEYINRAIESSKHMLEHVRALIPRTNSRDI